MKKSLFECLKEYGESDVYPFHMPGHKRNPQSGPLAPIYKWDITEIDGFDNLHLPEGILRDVQLHAAACYKSEETFFLVNGSTAGILSAVSAIAGRGSKLIVARNCHKAVYHAAFLNRLELEYQYPPVREDFDLPDGLDRAGTEAHVIEIVRKAGLSMEEAGNLIAGIVLTSPTYDGMLSDVEGIAQMAHSYGIPLIVDQAHGAHFGFHPAFPVNAVSQGADLVIHSVHKTLPAPTQTALLHCNHSLIDRELLKKYLRIYQSSSPSYILMAGIDSCMELVAKEGRQRLEQLLLWRLELTERVKKCRHIKIYPLEGELESTWKAGIQEPGRLVISVKGSFLTGQRLYDILRKSYHLQMEMAAANYVVAILSIMDTREGLIRLGNALIEIDEMISLKEQNQGKPQTASIILPFMVCKPKAVMKISDAFGAQSLDILLEEAEGETAAEFINLYPPGIPIVVPGERLDKEVIELIKDYIANGYTVEGVNRMHVIKTVKQLERHEEL